MTLSEVLVLFLVAGLSGALGQAIAGVSGRGCLASIALGFVGALLGRVVADKFNLPPIFVITVGGNPFPIVWAILFSALFVAVLSAFQRGSRGSKSSK
jgi:uncharacterized membrane protein YeaQ/YmgE (transglycosylase-associated protein family)